jgi:hypothetical protein
MNTRFHDLENEHNVRNGELFNDRHSVMALLDELRKIEPPFMCQLVGDNGFNLIVGIDRDFGCVQHGANDGMPPFMMAVSRNPAAHPPEMDFLVGGTATPIAGRYLVPFDTVTEIVAEFVNSGEKSNVVSWEELDPGA